MAAGLAAATLALAVALAPSPRLIAFVHGGDIWVVGTNGQGARDLTRTPGASESTPTWSPDGTQLAYMRATAVWEMNADGRNQRQVVPPLIPRYQDAIVAGVTWSSKNQIAYMTWDATRQIGDIAIANPDGSGAHALGLDPNLPGEHRSPVYDNLTWSPDGGRLFFGLDNIEDQAGILSVAADGSDWRHVAGTIRADDIPAISPDGARLVYTRPRPRGGGYNYDLRIAAITGAGARNLTQWRGDDFGGSWSPDGRTFVFASQRGAKPLRELSSPLDLYVIDVRTNRVHRLLHLPGNEFEPQWQPG